MTEHAQYTPAELKVMKETLLRGEMPECPRDSVKMTERPIGGGSFAYSTTSVPSTRALLGSG